MNEYCRLNIEYLWNAVDLKRTEHSDSLNLKSSIFNSQFPDTAGFTLRYNRLVRIRIINPDLCLIAKSEIKQEVLP